METRFNRTTIGFLIAGLIIGFLVGYAGVSKNDSNDAGGNKAFVDDMLGETAGTKPDDSLLSADIKGIVSADAYALSVDNQAAGNTALVSHIELPTTAWVAITEDVNGGLGYILGAQRLPAGVHANITVQLLRATVPVNPYHAVIYADDGDGIFDFKSDTLVTTDAGDILMSNFATVN